MSVDDIFGKLHLLSSNVGDETQIRAGQGDNIFMKQLDLQNYDSGSSIDKNGLATELTPSFPKTPTDPKEDLSSVAPVSLARSSLKHMHDLYETVAEITAEPISRDEIDVKAFFKVLKKHRLQSKLVYILTVVSIVAISHFVLTVRWLLPYYYTITTPILLFLRLIMYWKLKYQYFMLDFCYFANAYWLIYIWIVPESKEMFAVGFAIANGPLIWSLLIFKNSLVFHSLDHCTSLYVHLLPSLMSFVIRWYPTETSGQWYKEFPHSNLGITFFWVVLIPFVFFVLHQMFYIIMVMVVLKPSEDYLTLYRFVIRKETSLLFHLCNLLGPRYRVVLYIVWAVSAALVMLLFNPLWYNFYAAHCVILIFFIILAIYNGATYYIDVFSLGRGMDKSKSPKSQSASGQNSGVAVRDCNNVKAYDTLVTCMPGREGVVTRSVQ